MPKISEFPTVTTLAANDYTPLARGGINVKYDLNLTIARDGSRAPTADIPFGGHKITGLADGVNPTDAANLEQVAASQLASLFSINPLLWYGYIGDGNSHPLSSINSCQGQNTSGWTLAQWQVLFPRALALSEQIDRHAIQRFCDLSPLGCRINIPAGTGMIDVGIVTGGTQSINIRGAGRDLTTLLFSQAGGTFWTHGNASTKANAAFEVGDIKIQTNTIAACAFNVWFTGTQTPYCHTMNNVVIQPVTTGQYFQNACITRNIQRGLQWRYVVAYGAYGTILSTDAFLFPCNTDNTTSGDTYDFYDCMTVGWRYGVCFDATGYTSSTNHAFEEAQFYNFQSYAGAGLFKYDNQNTNIAPGDNWTFTACGWQGTGPAFYMRRLEFVRCRDSLFVNDTTTGTDIFGTMIGISDGLFDANEFFSITGTTLTGFRISDNAASPTAFNLRFRNNFVIAYSAFAQFYYFDATLTTAGMVDERSGSFRGTATYTNGYVNDASGLQVSESRAIQKATANSGGTAFVAGSMTCSVLSNGDILFSARYATSTANSSGESPTIVPPGGLFRSVKDIKAGNYNTDQTPFPVGVKIGGPLGVIVRYANGSSNAGSGVATTTSLEMIGN